MIGGSNGPDELFQLLGNPTRMRIMRALWRAHDFEAYVTGARDPVPFSQLREDAGGTDSGNFNYHLTQLVDGLIEDREDGYLLTPLGRNLMQGLDRYGTFEYDTVPPTVIESPCPFCSGDLVASYERELVHVRCEDCGGLADGNINFVAVPATGIQGLELPRMLDAATLEMAARIRSSRHGICWECHGALDRSIEFCGAHDRTTGGVCEVCDHRFRAQVEASCPNCGVAGVGPVLEYAVISTPVRAFFSRNGVGRGDIGPWEYRLTALGAVEETVESTDPPAVRFRFVVEADERIVVVRERGTDIAITATSSEGPGASR